MLFEPKLGMQSRFSNIFFKMSATNSDIWYGVIHEVRMLRRRRSGLGESVLARMGEGGVRIFFFAGSLQSRNKMKKVSYSDRIIHSHLTCTVKKYNLDPWVLLGVLIRHFLIAFYSSFFIL